MNKLQQKQIVSERKYTIRKLNKGYWMRRVWESLPDHRESKNMQQSVVLDGASNPNYGATTDYIHGPNRMQNKKKKTIWIQGELIQSYLRRPVPPCHRPTWIMMASIQGNPVLASLHASSSSSSSFQGIYKNYQSPKIYYIYRSKQILHLHRFKDKKSSRFIKICD